MITNPAWKYQTAQESRKPGYLKHKFDRIRRDMKAAEASKVTQLKKKAA